MFCRSDESCRLQQTLIPHASYFLASRLTWPPTISTFPSCSTEGLQLKAAELVTRLKSSTAGRTSPQLQVACSNAAYFPESSTLTQPGDAVSISLQLKTGKEAYRHGHEGGVPSCPRIGINVRGVEGLHGGDYRVAGQGP